MILLRFRNQLIDVNG